MAAPKLNLAQTNIGNLGSDLEKSIRTASGAGEPQWKDAGKVVGLQIWRIEKFKVVPVPKNMYGSFFTGDSYIVLSTRKKHEKTEALAWDIHYWLGLETTQDEAGTAAYKTVELDDFLGGAPVQHREVQDWESKMFLSYFPNGIRIMEGGIDSGFKHIEAAKYRPRLLQLKGKRNVRLREVPLTLKSVNSGDVFILDIGLKLLQFNGSKSAPMERTKAAEVCRLVVSEREGRATITVFEEADKEYPKEWVDHLGKGAIASAAEGGDDLAFEREPTFKKLFRLSDASGKLTMTASGEGAAVSYKSLDTNDVFIVDIGTEVFAWIGKNTTAQERKNGMRYAEQYLKDAQRPLTTPISRVIEGSENQWFLTSIGAK
jgi:gelsolin